MFTSLKDITLETIREHQHKRDNHYNNFFIVVNIPNTKVPF